MIGIPEEIPSQIICQICQEIATDPLVCSNCRYWTCKTCLDDWKKARKNCPIRCANPTFMPPSDTDLRNVSYIEVTCDCPCGEKMLLRNNLEHKVLIDQPHLCFNNSRCQSFGRFKIPSAKVVFCSNECYDVYLVARSKTNDLWKNIAAELETSEGKLNMVRSRFLPEKVEYPFTPVGKNTAIAEESDPAFAMPEYGKFEYSGTSRFFKTLYLKERLNASMYIINISTNSEEYFKIGFAKEKVKGDNYCFSDNDNGEAYVTMGQMRKGSASTGEKIGTPLRNDVTFTIKINFDKGQVQIEDYKNNFMQTTLPFTKELLDSKPYFALAFKKPTKFSMACFDFE